MDTIENGISNIINYIFAACDNHESRYASAGVHPPPLPPSALDLPHIESAGVEAARQN